ncbi:hypothetical protein J6590_052508 [Homalodisca vitripennis]|nr:hypothetical protein J6590_052508 [Homalodisca vitripennis]
MKRSELDSSKHRSLARVTVDLRYDSRSVIIKDLYPPICPLTTTELEYVYMLAGTLAPWREDKSDGGNVRNIALLVQHDKMG